MVKSTQPTDPHTTEKQHPKKVRTAPRPLGNDPLASVAPAPAGARPAAAKARPKNAADKIPAPNQNARKDFVLVTGGSGLIGNHVVRLLLERGYRVRCLVMPGESRAPFRGFEVELVEGSLTDHASHLPMLQGVDGVIHLAAIYALWLPDPATMYRVNVEGTRHFLGQALTCGLKKVVFTSSIAALGVRKDGRPANEDDPFNQWATANDYVWSKYQSDLEVQLLAARGLPVTIVNPCFPVGIGDRAPTPTGEIILNVLRGRFLGYLKNSGFNIVDVEDVALGHVLAYEKGQVGRRYLLGNRNISQRDLIRLIQAIAGTKKVPDRAIPLIVYRTVARGMELLAELTGKPPLSTVKTLETANQYLYYDCSRAVDELGLPQTPIEEAIRKAIDWFRANDYV